MDFHLLLQEGQNIGSISVIWQVWYVKYLMYQEYDRTLDYRYGVVYEDKGTMKIAYVLPEFVTEKEAGGLAVYYDNIARLLADAGHEIYIFVLSDRTRAIPYYPGIVVEQVSVDLRKVNAQVPGSFIRERSRVFAGKLLEYRKKGVDFDLVQYPNLWAMGLVRVNIPTVVRISSYQPLLRAADQEYFDIEREYEACKASDYLEEIATLRADTVYSPSRCTADIISRRTGREIRVIESPFYPRSTGDEREGIYEEKLKGRTYVLTFGTLKALKGAKLIGDCIYRVFSMCPGLEWVFAGAELSWKNKEGESVSPEEYIRNHALEHAGRVHFLGKLDREDLFPVIRHALFCVFPSRIDNLPNVCIEAMALGKAVIGTRGASFEQLIVHEKSGFLIERENEEALIAAVKHVYSLSDDERDKIGRMAKKRIEEMRPQKIMAQLLRFYSETIQSFNGLQGIDRHTRLVIAKYNRVIRNVDAEDMEECELSLEENGG